MTGAVERKSVKSAEREAPDFLAAVGVGNGEWLFALKIYYEVLKSLDSAEAWKLAMVLTPAAFSWGKWNQDYCARQGLKGPLNSLLCIRELRDASGRKTGEVEPYTPKTAADDAGIHKSNADRAYGVFERMNLFMRVAKNDGTNGKVLWATTKPVRYHPQKGGEETSQLSRGMTGLPTEITDRIVALRELARKPFFSTFTHFDLRPDPQLVIYQGYCIELEEAMKKQAKEARERATACAAEITAAWRTKSGVIPGDDRPVISKDDRNGHSVVPGENGSVIPRGNIYKEQVSSTSNKPPNPPAGGGITPSSAQPIQALVPDPKIRQRVDALFNSWKKHGSGRRSSREACMEMTFDAVKRGADLDYIEAGLTAWIRYWSEAGWQFCKPTLADMIGNRAWEMLPPDPHAGGKKSSTDRAMDMLYRMQLAKTKPSGGPS
jgi:hypothetical protein